MKRCWASPWCRAPTLHHGRPFFAATIFRSDSRKMAVTRRRTAAPSTSATWRRCLQNSRREGCKRTGHRFPSRSMAMPRGKCSTSSPPMACATGSASARAGELRGSRFWVLASRFVFRFGVRGSGFHGFELRLRTTSRAKRGAGMKINPARRSFIRKAGVALSGPVAAAVASTPNTASAMSSGDAERTRLALLEDQAAIRAGNLEHMQQVNAEPHDLGEQDVIEIAGDRRSAKAFVHVMMELQNPTEPESPPVEIAGHHGGGAVRRTEHGVFEHEYVRRDGTWQRQRSIYRLA